MYTSPHSLPGTHKHIIVKCGTRRHSEAFITESTIIVDVFMCFSVQAAGGIYNLFTYCSFVGAFRCIGDTELHSSVVSVCYLNNLALRNTDDIGRTVFLLKEIKT